MTQEKSKTDKWKQLKSKNTNKKWKNNKINQKKQTTKINKYITVTIKYATFVMWFLLLLLEKVGEGDLLEGLEANTRVFVQIVFIFVMQGGVKTQTGSTHLKKSSNICYSNRLKSSRRSKRFCDFTVGRDGMVCSHPFVMILGNSQINSINLNSSQNKKGETFRKWQKNIIPDALNGSAEFGGGLLLGRVKFLYGYKVIYRGPISSHI